MTDAPLSASDGRPPRRRFGRHDRRADPAGRFEVAVERDVAKLLTPDFYVDGGFVREEALRHCAFGALMSFCHVTPWIACKIPMEHWLPDGLDAVRIDRRGELQNVPVCEGAYMVVERYLAEGRRRPPDCACPADGRCRCGMLLTSRTGGPLLSNNVMDTFERVGAAIGASLPVPDLLLRFCERKLEESGKKVEARRFMGYCTVEGPLDRPLPEVPFDDLAALARRAGRWFAPYARAMAGPAGTAELLAKEAGVPARYPKRRYAKSEPPRLTADHPLVAEMLAIVVPVDERALKPHRRWLIETYLKKIDPMVPHQMGVPQACELLLLETPKQYYAHRNYHFGSGRAQKAEYGKTRGARIKPPAPRIRPDKEQAVLLDRLRRYPWSEDTAVSAGQRRELVPECFAAVDAMERARAVKIMTARRLLRLDKVEWGLFRTAIEVGFPLDRVLPEGRYPPITPEWRRRLAEEHAARAPGESDTVVYFRLRTAGWEGHVFTVRGICEELRRAPPAPAEEPALVAMLRGHDWPADEAEVRKESERLLAEHVVEAAALVADGRAEGQALQALFRTYRDRFSFLLAALRAGLSVDQAMRPKEGRPVGPGGWEVAAAVTAAAGYGETVRTLYFRAVLAGFEGSEVQFRAGAERMRQVRAEGSA